MAWQIFCRFVIEDQIEQAERFANFFHLAKKRYGGQLSSVKKRKTLFRVFVIFRVVRGFALLQEPLSEIIDNDVVREAVKAKNGCGQLLSHFLHFFGNNALCTDRNLKPNNMIYHSSGGQSMFVRLFHFRRQ